MTVMNAVKTTQHVLFSPVRFIKEVISELKMVTWPTRIQTSRSTAIVIGFSVLVGVYIALLDLGFAKGIEFLLTLKK